MLIDGALYGAVLGNPPPDPSADGRAGERIDQAGKVSVARRGGNAVVKLKIVFDESFHVRRLRDNVEHLLQFVDICGLRIRRGQGCGTRFQNPADSKHLEHTVVAMQIHNEVHRL